MPRTSIGLVCGLLGLASLSCGGGRTALLALPSESGLSPREGAGLEPAGIGQAPTDAGACPASSGACQGERTSGCAKAGRNPMGCQACARARVPGFSCVAGACQQRRCVGPPTFGKVASYPPVLAKRVLSTNEYLGADMNRDGRLDLLEFTGSIDDPELAIWLGQGDGTFAPSTRYATVGDFDTPNLPGYAAVGDFNEDGLADLVVTEPDDRSAVSIRPGLRGGGLGGRSAIPGSRRLMADLDGDCHLDFVTTPNDVSTTTILVLRGRGNGTFAGSRKNLTRALVIPWALEDWNGDGILDILMEGTVLQVLPGKGDGSFAEAQRCAIGTGLRNTVYTDLNQDGRLDMLWMAGGSQGLATVFGQGGCSFTPRTNYAVTSRLTAFALGDLDGDGLPDILAASDLKGGSVPATTVFLTGTAEGRFTRQPDLAIDSHDVSEVLIADVNSDGRADLVLASTSRGIEVFVNSCAQ